MQKKWGGKCLSDSYINSDTKIQWNQLKCELWIPGPPPSPPKVENIIIEPKPTVLQKTLKTKVVDTSGWGKVEQPRRNAPWLTDS